MYRGAMSLPYLTASGKYDPVRAIGQKRERTVGQWGGLDERLITEENTFSAMQNMSSRFFPAIATREARGAAERTITKPHGLYHKNGLFWVDGTKCYYKGNEVSGLTVTDGDKQIVGMGAYICIFPDKMIYNTSTGEVTSVDATYNQSGTIKFSELSTDSVYCKVEASGIDDILKPYDGVTFEGVDDPAFKVDGKGATKVISETGSGYIVVPAVIQNGYTGTITMQSDGTKTKVSASAIQTKYKVGDHLRIVGCADEALNVDDKAVTAVGADYVVIDSPFSAKSYTQSSSLTFSPYYTGSSQTRVYGDDLGTTFNEGDVITIAGSNIADGTFTIVKAGVDYFLIDLMISASTRVTSGVTISRSKMTKSGITVKRTSFTVDSGATISRKSQDMDYVCEHDNRLWGCSSENHEIYASKLGDPTNWQCYEGISTDSYTVTVGSDGDFTGCCSHMGYVLFFKEDYIHQMYGNKPTNYQLNTKELPGVREGCSGSLCVVNETLFYVGRNGVYAFDGATPRKVSEEITSEITAATSGHQDDKLYVSCKKDGAQALLVYDPKYRTWVHEDGTRFKFASFGDGKLYYVDNANALRTITGDSTDLIEWSIESGDLRESMLDTKWISKARFSLWMGAGAEANIFFRFDEDPIWHRAGTVHSVTAKAYNIPIVPQRCNRFRWKMEGKGQVKLLAMGITVEGGSEINGNLQSWCRR